MRVLIKTSKWAIWARRFGRLAVPLVVLPLLLHHLGAIDSPSFFAAALAAAAVAGLAVLVGLIALARLWYSGDQGWGRALSGLFLGLVCLLPFAWYGALAWRWLHPGRSVSEPGLGEFLKRRPAGRQRRTEDAR